MAAWLLATATLVYRAATAGRIRAVLREGFLTARREPAARSVNSVNNSGGGGGGGGAAPSKPVLRRAFWALATRVVMARRWVLVVLALELLLVKGAYLVMAAGTLSPWQCCLAILVASAITAVPDVLLAAPPPAAPAEDAAIAAGAGGGGGAAAASGSRASSFEVARSPFQASASRQGSGCSYAPPSGAGANPSASAGCGSSRGGGLMVHGGATVARDDSAHAAYGGATAGAKAAGGEGPMGQPPLGLKPLLLLQSNDQPPVYDERIYRIRSPSSTMDFDSGSNSIVPVVPLLTPSVLPPHVTGPPPARSAVYAAAAAAAEVAAAAAAAAMSSCSAAMPPPPRTAMSRRAAAEAAAAGGFLDIGDRRRGGAGGGGGSNGTGAGGHRPPGFTEPLAPPSDNTAASATATGAGADAGGSGSWAVGSDRESGLANLRFLSSASVETRETYDSPPGAAGHAAPATAAGVPGCPLVTAGSGSANAAAAQGLRAASQPPGAANPRVATITSVRRLPVQSMLVRRGVPPPAGAMAAAASPRAAAYPVRGGQGLSYIARTDQELMPASACGAAGGAAGGALTSAVAWTTTPEAAAVAAATALSASDSDSDIAATPPPPPPGAVVFPSYRPVTRAKIVSVKVASHPGSFQEYAPRVCASIHDYLQTHPQQLLLTIAGSVTGGGGGGEPSATAAAGSAPAPAPSAPAQPLTSVRTLAVRGCVQVLSWVQSVPVEGRSGEGDDGSDGDDGGNGGDGGHAAKGDDGGGVNNLVSGLVAALPNLEALPSVVVQAGGAMASYSGTTRYSISLARSRSADVDRRAPPSDALLQSLAAERDAVQIVWIWPPFLPVYDGGDDDDLDSDAVAAATPIAGGADEPAPQTVDVEICIAVPFASPCNESLSVAAAATTVAAAGDNLGSVRLLLVGSESAAGCHVVLDEHVTLERGAASVVRVTLPAPRVARVTRVVVSAPTAEHMRDRHGDDGDAAAASKRAALPLVLGSAPLLCLPYKVSDELYGMIRCSAAAAMLTSVGDGAALHGAITCTDVAPSDQDPALLPDPYAGLAEIWDSFVAPLATDVAFLLDIAAAPPAAAAAAAGTAAVAAAAAAGTSVAAPPATFFQLPMCLSTGSGRVAGRTALAGLLAVEDSLKSALQPLGAKAAVLYISALVRRTVVSLLAPPPPGAAAATATITSDESAAATAGAPRPRTSLDLRASRAHGRNRMPADAATAAAATGAPSPPTPPDRGDAAAGGNTTDAAARAAQATAGQGQGEPSAPQPAPSSPGRSVERPRTPGPRVRRPSLSPSYEKLPYGSRRAGGSGAAAEIKAADSSGTEGDEVHRDQRARDGASAAPPPPASAPASSSSATAAAAWKGVSAPPPSPRAFAAAILSDRSSLLASPVTGFTFCRSGAGGDSGGGGGCGSDNVDDDDDDDNKDEGEDGGGASSTASTAGPPRRQPPQRQPGYDMEVRYERFCNVAYHGLDVAGSVMLLVMFGVVTWRKLLTPSASGPRSTYNLIMLWFVAGTVLMPYAVKLVRRELYVRHRERLMLVGQGVNALIYAAFAARLLPMPPEMKFHWNHSHVLQRGLVRPVRRPVRFTTHLWMLAIEVVGVTPAFLAASGWRRVLSTTVVTYTLSASVGYALDLAMRRVFLLSLVRQQRGAWEAGKD